jgi:hypothetical protein
LERSDPTKIPLKATEQSARGVPESVPAFSANPASGAGPSVQSPMTSPKGGRKLPIHSLKDGLLGCPLKGFKPWFLKAIFKEVLERPLLTGLRTSWCIIKLL